MNRIVCILTVVGLIVCMSVSACAENVVNKDSRIQSDLSISAEEYGSSGLFTRPLIPIEGETVTITVRASITGKVNGSVKAKLTITPPVGDPNVFNIDLTMVDNTATGSVKWSALTNGEYTLDVNIDPNNTIAEASETNCSC